MKKLLLILLPIILTVSVYGQAITDTGALRTQINTDIVPNAAGGITATKLNRILLGFINSIPKLSWGISGTANTTPGTHFIGTTDQDSLFFKVANEQSGLIDNVNRNTSFGYQAMINTTGSSPNAIRNTAFGYQALNQNTTGSQNTAHGYQALMNNTTGANTAVGYLSLNQNTTGTLNTALGNIAMFLNTTGFNNTAVGYSALTSNSTGKNNTALGLNALQANTTADSSTAVGVSALTTSSTGISNTAIGMSSLYANTTGTYNAAIGHKAGYTNTTGSYNTYVGSGIMGITTGSNNTILGARVTGLSASLAGNIIIADGAGNIKAQHDGTNWALTGNVGFGTTSPTARLHVTQTAPASVATDAVTATESPLTIAGGDGGATSSNGAVVTAGNAGDVSMVGGTGGAITGAPITGIGGIGGDLVFTGGVGGLGTTFGGRGGDVEFQGGTGGGGTSGGRAGYASLKAGNAGSTGNANGGNVYVVSGIGNGSGNSGTIFLGLSPSLTVRGNTVLGATTDDYTNKLQVTGSFKLMDAGNKINIATGSNASTGLSAAMTAGTITISTTAVTASSLIFLTPVGAGAGQISLGTVTASTSFVINSSDGADVRAVQYWIIN